MCMFATLVLFIFSCSTLLRSAGFCLLLYSYFVFCCFTLAIVADLFSCLSCFLFYFADSKC